MDGGREGNGDTNTIGMKRYSSLSEASQQSFYFQVTTESLSIKHTVAIQWLH